MPLRWGRLVVTGGGSPKNRTALWGLLYPKGPPPYAPRGISARAHPTAFLYPPLPSLSHSRRAGVFVSIILAALPALSSGRRLKTTPEDSNVSRSAFSCIVAMNNTDQGCKDRRAWLLARRLLGLRYSDREERSYVG